MGLKLLFICTGNTCRSPIAEGLARDLFGDEVQVSSAGIEAWTGENASPHALEVLAEHNIDLSEHRARKIREELMSEADWVIPMTRSQAEGLKRLFPKHAHKLRCLGDWGERKRDVQDPWGGSLISYRQTAQEIRELLGILKEQLNV
ncbi:MAG: low molecular weight protein arginine phosphatase [Bacillota bacterium]|nr:low molecular weight protein arginine phosphatase [Bacillota bacterium]MDP4160742.1 low molecular weight protein arginine phosphatase [Bacillota bacterium]